MNVRQSMLQRIAEQPGITVHQLHTALGIAEEKKRRAFYAQLSKLCQEGNVRKESVHSTSTGSPKLWPTPTTLLTRKNRPPKSSGITIAKRAPVTMSAPASARAQSVDDFLANGGRIEYLGPHESGTPLRFDHSDNKVAIGRRRAVSHHRKSSTV